MVSNSKQHKKQIRIIENEIALVKFLSSNNENERNRALKKIKRVLTYRSQVTDIDFSESESKILWKGLFYCLWMADKPLYQEQVAENISQLIHCFTRLRDALIFLEGFFHIMSQEWLGIDQFRMDKCLMLVRRMVRQSMEYVGRSENWNETAVENFANCYFNILKKSVKGLIMQLSELYLIELAKVSQGKLSPEQVFQLVRPFAEYFSTQTDGRLISQIVVPIFLSLIQQTDIGIEHQAKWEAWRDRGFPGGSIDVMEKEDTEEITNGNMCDTNGDGFENSDEDYDDDDDDDAADENKPLDPRAGRVDVELPTLNIDPRLFVEFFSKLKEKKEISRMGRKQLTVLIQKYSILAEGKFPLGMQKLELPPKTNWKNFTSSAAKKLAVDLLDDELKKIESLNNQLHVKDELRTCAGRWSIEPVDSAVVKKKKKKLRKKSGKNVPVKWVTTATNQDDEIANNGLDKTVVSASMPEESPSSNIIRKRKSDETSNHLKPSKSKKTVQINGTKKSQDSITINGDSHDTKIWDSPLEEGETEIFIPNKKYVSKRRKLGLAVPKPQFVQNSVNSDTPTQKKSPNSRNKRVLFVLTKNKSQDEKEYHKTLKTNPQIPFNSKKQPKHPIYKDTGVKSPINPFYKNKGYTKI